MGCADILRLIQRRLCNIKHKKEIFKYTEKIKNTRNIKILHKTLTKQTNVPRGL